MNTGRARARARSLARTYAYIRAQNQISSSSDSSESMLGSPFTGAMERGVSQRNMLSNLLPTFSFNIKSADILSVALLTHREPSYRLINRLTVEFELKNLWLCSPGGRIMKCTLAQRRPSAAVMYTNKQLRQNKNYMFT